MDDAKRRGSSFLQVARSSFLRRVSGLSNDIESGSKEDDDGTVESIDMEDEDELMDVSAAVVIASGNQEHHQDSNSNSPSPSSHSTRKLVLISLLLLVVGLAVGLGIGLSVGRNNINETDESMPTTSTATTAPVLPTLFPTDEEDDCFPDFDPDSFNNKLVEFPCLLGMQGEEAAALLEAAYPDMLDIQVLPENSPITMDLRFNRVRIFVSHLSQLVVQVPHVG